MSFSDLTDDIIQTLLLLYLRVMLFCLPLPVEKTSPETFLLLQSRAIRKTLPAAPAALQNVLIHAGMIRPLCGAWQNVYCMSCTS